MGFYGNYLKINAGEGLIVEERGQEIKINLEPQLLNFLNSKDSVIKGVIWTKEEFIYLLQGQISTDLKIGDCFLVKETIIIQKEDSYKYNYEDHDKYVDPEGNTIIQKNTVLICTKHKEEGGIMSDAKWFFSNYTLLLDKVKIHPVWNGDDNKILKFYNEEVESDSVEDNSIIVDRENQTISVKKDGEKIVVGNVNDIGLEKGNKGKGLQSVNADNDIQAENSVGFGKGLKNTENNINQSLRGTYNKIDEKNKYIDIVGNGSSDEQRSNAYALDKEGNAYFAGDVYVQNKDAGEPVKLITELQATETKEFIQHKKAEIINISQLESDDSLVGIDIQDRGNYLIKITSLDDEYVFCNDRKSTNEISWPYIGEQNKVVSTNDGNSLTISWNSFGELIINGATTSNPYYNFGKIKTTYDEDKSTIYCKIFNPPNNLNQEKIALKIEGDNVYLSIDTDGTNVINFNNCRIQPYYSNASSPQSFEDIWHPPHGSLFKLRGNRTINLDPNYFGENIQILQIYSYEKSDKMVVEYTKNINETLKYSPDSFLSPNQIALKKDTLYTLARCGEQIIKVRPVVHKKIDNNLSIEQTQNIINYYEGKATFEEQEHNDYQALYSKVSFTEDKDNFNYIYSKSDSHEVLGTYVDKDTGDIWRINHTQRTAKLLGESGRFFKHIENYVNENADLKNRTADVYKEWNSSTDQILLIDSQYIYFIKYINKRVRTDNNENQYGCYEGFTGKYKYTDVDGGPNSRFEQIKVYAVDKDNGGTKDDYIFPHSLTARKGNYKLLFDSILSSSSDNYSSITDWTDKIVHTKDYIVLCHNCEFNQRWPQITWIDKKTMEIKQVLFTCSFSTYENTIEYLPIYYHNQIIISATSEEHESNYLFVFQLLSDDLTIKSPKLKYENKYPYETDLQDQIKEFNRGHVTINEINKNLSQKEVWYSITYNNISPVCFTKQYHDYRFDGAWTDCNRYLAKTKIFRTNLDDSEKYIVIIQFVTDPSSSSKTDSVYIINVNEENDEVNKIYMPELDDDQGFKLYQDEYDGKIKNTFKLFLTGFSAKQYSKLMNLTNSYYNPQDNGIYYNYKTVDINSSGNIMDNFIRVDDTNPGGTLTLPYTYLVLPNNKNEPTIYKDLYYVNDTTNNIEIKRTVSSITGQLYVLDYYEAVEEV